MVIKKNNPQKKKILGSSVPSETDKTSKKLGNSGKSAEVIVPMQQPSGSFPIVGIGASSGGMAALETFFSGTGSDGALVNSHSDIF